MSCGPTATCNHAKLLGLSLMTVMVFFSELVSGAGLTWPSNQLLPTFSTTAPVLDCIDVSSASNPEIDLFASLEGIVNRAQPRVACVSTVNGEGEFAWVNLHNLSTNLLNWVNIGIATETQPGQYEFNDVAVTNWPQRFYRLTAP